MRRNVERTDEWASGMRALSRARERITDGGALMPALMSLDDRIMHLPGNVHGFARCGESMRDPWLCGPLPHVAEKAEDVCLQCFANVDEHDWKIGAREYGPGGTVIAVQWYCSRCDAARRTLDG